MTKVGRRATWGVAANRPLSALVIGRAGDVHFHSSLRVLERHANRHMSAACELPSDACGIAAPALVMLLQSHPGEFSQIFVDELRRRWPLARIIAIAGSWCEGEPRTGGNLAGVYRVTWDIAAARLVAELPKLAAGLGAFALPPTTTAEERSTTIRPRDFSERLIIAVAARRVSSAEPLIDALHAAGACAMFYSLEQPPIARGVDATVWDASGCEAALPMFHAKLPQARAVVAVCGFPRPQDQAALHQLKVAAVLAQPLQIDDLIVSIEATLPQAGAAKSSRAEVA